MVTRLDRLARSTRDLLNTLDTITKRGAGFRSLADTWADTTTSHGRLMLTVLGGLAEFERELIRARTGEGRARAKAAGVHMGRPSKLNRDQQREAIVEIRTRAFGAAEQNYRDHGRIGICRRVAVAEVDRQRPGSDCICRRGDAARFADRQRDLQIEQPRAFASVDGGAGGLIADDAFAEEAFEYRHGAGSLA